MLEVRFSILQYAKCEECIVCSIDDFLRVLGLEMQSKEKDCLG